jgi:phage gp16-like protein
MAVFVCAAACCNKAKVSSAVTEMCKDCFIMYVLKGFTKRPGLQAIYQQRLQQEK